MLPDLTVLVALLVGLFALEGGGSADPARSLLGTALCVLIGSALSRLAVGRGLRALEEDDTMMAEVTIRWTVTWPLVAWIGCLWFFDWGAWVAQDVPREWWLARLLVLFAPAFIAFAVGWVGRAQLQSEIVLRRGGVPAPPAAVPAVLREVKRNALIFVPLVLVLGITEGIWVAGALGLESMRTLSLWIEAMPLLNIGLMFGLILIALPFIPRMFGKMLKAEPLGPGPLRTTLERCAQAIDLRYRDIMIWRTGGRVFNAMVVGFTPGTRTIFLTDGLLNVMPEEELVAVFFHEAGHAKRHHLLLFLVSFFSLSLLFHGAAEPLLALGIPAGVQIIMHLVLIWFGLLGWVSRRFERESDIYGSAHAGVLEPDAPPLYVPGLPAPLPRGAALMMRALERIRTIVGHGGSHRHGTVEERVAFVADHATDPATRLRFESGRRNLLLGLLGLCALGVLTVALNLPDEVSRAESYVASQRAFDHYEQAWRLDHTPAGGAAEAARTKWLAARTGFTRAAERLAGLDDPHARALRVQNVHNAAATALHGLDDREGARAGFEETLGLIEALPEGERVQPFATLLGFETHIELGRLSAWDQAELPPGNGDPDFAETLTHLQSARELKLRSLEDASLFSEGQRELFSERLRLLIATYEAARGEHEEARKALSKLAQLGGGAKRQFDDLDAAWADHEAIEIAEDARRELERLPPPK